jgi:3-dehydroquinate synthetase/predicted kinase
VAPHALNSHVVLVGFMGAGKTTVGEEVAQRLGRWFMDTDRVVESDAGRSITEIFDMEGEEAFRAKEAAVLARLLTNASLGVIAVGGGAVTTQAVREMLESHAFSVWLDVDVETAWSRAQSTLRPLAQDERVFRRLYDVRRPLYDEVADARASDADDVVLAAGGVHVEAGSLQRLGGLVPGDGPVALVTEPQVAGIHGADAQLALGARLAEVHELRQGERAKTVAEAERLWRALRIDRNGTILALGGGALTDAAGFVASTYLRGCAVVHLPSTLIGQVDAAIGGKTAIDLPEGKNLVGTFHWPERTIVDPALLDTLPADERRNGMAEVVKTGLLAGEPLWALPDAELVRRCAAYKAAVCLRDPYDRGVRRTLNLGHTFAHALEAAADFALPHGRAVALGLRAALKLSGKDAANVNEVLAPEPVRVDPERAWEALLRDKKGRLRLILLGDDGAYEAEVPEHDVRIALGELVAK